jgi:predicted DNA-binding protein (MmcQ/YjbR family)
MKNNQMIKEKLEKHCAKLKGSEGSYPFGPDALVFKVMGKMFALVSQSEKIPRVTLKCNPADGEILISQFESVVPGYYMNKKHWITISLCGELSEELLLDLAKQSYNLVVGKLTKSNRKKLEQKFMQR